MIARSLVMNGLHDRVHLYQNALSDFTGTSFINFHRTNKGIRPLGSLPFQFPLTYTHIRSQADLQSKRWERRSNLKLLMIDFMMFALPFSVVNQGEMFTITEKGY